MAATVDPYGFRAAHDAVLAEADALALKNPDEFDKKLRTYEQLLGQPTGAARLRTRPLSSYQPDPVKWLWDQRIPEGKISVLAGDGGEGKSFATLGIAASLTTGNAMPGGIATEPRSVLIWNGEDGPEDTIVIRAKNSGADLDKIHIIEGTEQNGKKRGFSLKDIPLLVRRVESEPEIGLVVIDPVTALLANTDSNRDTEIRAALQPLADLALRTGVAILLVMHLKKGEEVNVLHRVSGSVAFGALARSVMMVGTHADGRKSMDTVKHNLAMKKPVPIEFCLNGGFKWVGPAPDLTAERIRVSRVKANRSEEPDEAFDSLIEYADKKGLFNGH